MATRTAIARALGCLLVFGNAASTRGEPDAGTAPKRPNASAARPTFAEALHSTSALSRMRMRCRASGQDDADHKPLDTLHCAFATVSLRQQPPEKMATLENYGEILRELRAQCRADSPRSEPGRIACAACRSEFSDACLYEQAMKELRKDCDKPVEARVHANPAVAALQQADAARGLGSALMGRFCAACGDVPSASCLSDFWAQVHAPARCTVAMDGFEVELARQGKTSTWTANLGGPCNTQITLALDERRKTWTYTEARLSPERCAQGEALAQAHKPAVYSSSAQYVFPDLSALCERLTFL